MSYSRILLIHGPAMSLKPKASEIVCCCPWSGSNANKRGNKNISKVNPAPFSLFLEPVSTLLKGWEKAESPDKRWPVLPPGPSLLHLLGLIHYAMRSLPYHHALRDLANTYGPLVHVKLGEVSTIIVSSADLAREVLRTRDPACADRPRSVATQLISYDYTGVVLTPYDEYWRQMRNVCMAKFLSPRNVRALEYIRQEEGSSLVDFIRSASGAPFNLTERIFLFMNSTAGRAVYGETRIDKAEAVAAIKRGFSLGANFAIADMFPSIKALQFISLNKRRMMKLKKKVDEVLDSIIDDHRKKLQANSNGELGSEDLVDILLRLNESEEFPFQITDDRIKSVTADMFGAITETSSSLVDWAMAELMRNPRTMAKARDEVRQAFNGRKMIQESDIRSLKYLKLVIKETLRLHPPTAVITRACREEIEVDGYHIPLNANVIVNIWGIGRDPSYWHDPESFIPERFEANHIDFNGAHFEYIPFGAGKRICPGITFGLANAEFLLAKLIYHFDWRLPPGMRPHRIDMTETDGMAVSRKKCPSPDRRTI